MFDMSLSGIYEYSIRRIEQFTSTPHWRIKFVVSLTILSLVLATPQFSGYKKTFSEIKGWQAFNQQKEHPFTPLNFSGGSNAAKRTFRLTVPVLAKIFRLNDYAVIVIEWLLNILFLFFSILLFEKITKDKTLALLGTIGLTFIYNGHAGFTDNNAWFDVFAYLFLLLAMFYSNAFLIFILIFFAAWTDERAIFGSLLVFFWWKLNETKVSEFSFPSFFKFEIKSSMVILALVVYSIGRFLLMKYGNLSIPFKEVGLDVLFNSTGAIGLGLWSALEGFWLLIIVCLIFLFTQKKYSVAFSLIGLMTLIMLVAFSVHDITKSAGYIFPVIFISVSILTEKFSQIDLRKILLLCAAVCFLFPSYYYASHDHIAVWYKPFFVKAFEIFKSHI